LFEVKHFSPFIQNDLGSLSVPIGDAAEEQQLQQGLPTAIDPHSCAIAPYGRSETTSYLIFPQFRHFS